MTKDRKIGEGALYRTNTYARNIHITMQMQKALMKLYIKILLICSVDEGWSSGVNDDPLHLLLQIVVGRSSRPRTSTVDKCMGAGDRDQLIRQEGGSNL